MKAFLNHPEYKLYANRYEVSDDGKVFNLKTSNSLKVNINPKTNMRFVRLSAGKNKSLSIGLARLMLLTFNPKSYYSGAIAVHFDLNPANNNLSNLLWGTRKMQSKFRMRKKPYFERVSMMAKLHHSKKRGRIIDDKEIIDLRLSGLTGKEIAKKMLCRGATVGTILHRNGYKTINGKLVKVVPYKDY